jgi:hypothetical protein
LGRQREEENRVRRWDYYVWGQPSQQQRFVFYTDYTCHVRSAEIIYKSTVNDPGRRLSSSPTRRCVLYDFAESIYAV